MKWRLTFFAIVALCYACIAWIPETGKKMGTSPTPTILDPEFRFDEFSATVAGTSLATSIVKTNAIQIALNPQLPNRRLYLFAWTKGPIDNTCVFTYRVRFSRNNSDVFILESAATPFFPNTRPFNHIFQPTFANAVQNLAGASGNLGFSFSPALAGDCVQLWNSGSPGIGDFGTNEVFAVSIAPWNMAINADQLFVDITNCFGTPNMIYALWCGIYSYE